MKKNVKKCGFLLNKRLNVSNQKGLSMIELGLVFSVIGVSVAAILYAYGSTQRAYSLQTAAQQVQQIGAAENAYMMEQATGIPEDVSSLYTDGYIDYNYGTTGDHQLNNAFGTKISVSADPNGGTSGDTAFFVNMGTGSQKNCNRMVREWNNDQSGTKAYCNNSGAPSSSFPDDPFAQSATDTIVHILFNPNSLKSSSS